MTFTRAPVVSESSVTELPYKFATQTWVPTEVMASGPLNPQPRTLTPESCLTGVADGETWEALLPVAPTADAGTKLTRVRPDRVSPVTATVRLNRRKSDHMDRPPRIDEGAAHRPAYAQGDYNEADPHASQTPLPKGRVLR